MLLFLALSVAGFRRFVAQDARETARLTQITGRFEIRGTSPDGDSLRFYPDHSASWESLPGRPIRTNRKGGAQVRLEAIDALETHYAVKGFPHGHQPLDLAEAAAAALLREVGFSRVVRSSTGTVVDADPVQVAGYILVSSSDAYGRCLGFVFKGAPEGIDGVRPGVDMKELQRSANYQLLAQGLVYPTFYAGLPRNIRENFAKAAYEARRSRKGVWEKDLTAMGLTVTSVEALGDSAYIFPKLYRRLVEYLATSPQPIRLELFVAHLRSKNDRILLLPEDRMSSLADLIHVDHNSVKLTRPLEDLVFQE